ncbi:hypothetical protein [Cellulomonas sp. URHB0016]
MTDHFSVPRVLRDLDRPVPGIALTGWRTRVPMPRPGLTFPVVLLAGGTGLLVREARTGFAATAPYHGFDLPVWIPWAIAVAFGLGLLLKRVRDPRPSWYRWWSFVDYREEPGGIRLLSNRAKATDPGVLVRRGENVEIHARLVGGSVEGGREYEFRIHAPGGDLEFRAEIFVQKLSMAPLDEQATRWGFTLSTHGKADRIRRAAPTQDGATSWHV